MNKGMALLSQKYNARAVPNFIKENKGYVSIWLGMTILTFTLEFYSVALPFIVYKIDNSSFSMAMMRMIEYLPNILLGVFIGTLVDRYNRKRFMQANIIMQILFFTILLILLVNNNINLWYMYIIGFCVSGFGYALGTAYHAVIPQLVSKEKLTEVNSLISFFNTFIGLTGPGIAGMVILSVSQEYSIIFTLIGLLPLLLITTKITIPSSKKQKENTNFLQETQEGWKYLISEKTLLYFTCIIMLLNIASTITSSVFAFYAIDSLHVKSNLLGVIYSSASLGGIIASIYSKKIVSIIKRGKAIVFSVLLNCLGQLIFFLSVNWQLLSLGMLITGFSITFINIHYLTLRQETTPNYLLGRVAGTSSMVMKMAMPISYFMGGLISNLLMVQTVFLISSIIAFSVFIVALKIDIKKLI